MKRNRFKYMLLLLVLAGIGGSVIYLLSHGFSARDEPSVVEAFIARGLRRLAIPRGAREATNPVAANPEVLSEAMEHFADHCATCHGNDGSGNTAIGRGLYPKPPDMRQAGTQGLSDGELYYIVHNGVRFTGMPAFGASDSPEDNDSWKLVHFIRRLPRISDEELARMKDMNPKSPGDLQEEDEIKKFLEGDDNQPSNAIHKHH